jgi:hypothetical protein
MSAHIGGKEQARIGLIYRIAFRAGEVNEVLAVFQHFCSTGLFTGFICQMRRKQLLPSRLTFLHPSDSSLQAFSEKFGMLL